jgi:leader peptidase (prepilin peptidase)/N-methyltransferase
MYSYAFIFGLLFGSFANVVVYRVPRGLSVVRPRSACPACGAVLGLLELVPLLGWLILRGKCRRCRTKISPRYPFVELLTASLFAISAWWAFPAGVLTDGVGLAGSIVSFAALCVLMLMLICISFIDADTQEIPDGLVITAAIAGLVWVIAGAISAQIFAAGAAPPAWYHALIGALAGALPLLIIDRVCILVLKKDGFGYGDVKLMAAVGLFLGWQLTLLAFFIAFVMAAGWALVLILRRQAGRGSYIAFGPFLCGGAVVAFFWGERIIELYLRGIGL